MSKYTREIALQDQLREYYKKQEEKERKREEREQKKKEKQTKMSKDSIYFCMGKPVLSTEILYCILLQFNMLNRYYKEEFTEAEYNVLCNAYHELSKLYNRWKMLK